MKITVNGQPHKITATNLAAVLEELGYGASHVATALNQEFVANSARQSTSIKDGDVLEILAPMKGG